MSAEAHASVAGKVRALIVFGAAIEAVTGLVLLIVPSLFGRLILGNELLGVAGGAVRIAGVALLAFAVACWPEPGSSAKHSPAVRGLLVYNLLAVLYFVFWRYTYSLGPLFWAAVALHAVLASLFARVALRQRAL